MIDKPAGLNVVPGPPSRTDTLVNRIKVHWAQTGGKPGAPYLNAAGPVHQWVVWVARHRLANSLASQLQAQHQVDKRYLAIVSGRLSQDHGMIDEPLAIDPTGYNQMVSPAGKPAQTEYWVKERFDQATLVEVKLHTGRTHQFGPTLPIWTIHRSVTTLRRPEMGG